MRKMSILGPPPAFPTELKYHEPAPPSSAKASPRLVSLDAYRGFVMLLMASSGLGIAALVKAHHLTGAWQAVAHQADHVEWRGGALWDMIQPSFTFIVGVAIPFSLAKRRSQGQSFFWLTLHAVVRSLILIALGIFLRSLHKPMTNVMFTDTLGQIGLGYTFAFMLAWLKPRWQVAAVAVLLVGYWLTFALYRLPTSSDYAEVGVTEAWRAENPISQPDAPFREFAHHWDKNTNIAMKFDVWFLNLFPRDKPFKFERGGYATLNFIPTLATMLLGLLAGNLMMSAAAPWKKVGWLILFGLLGIGAGWGLDYLGICPNVKRIWTPGWVLYSGGWACLLLALFYMVVDWAGQRWIVFPVVVVGMNSIAMYCLADGGFVPYITANFDTHLGRDFFERMNERIDWIVNHACSMFNYTAPVRTVSYAPITQWVAVLLVLWLITFWMYRRKIFLKI